MRRFSLWALLLVGIAAAVGLLLLVRSEPPAVPAGPVTRAAPAASGGEREVQTPPVLRPDAPAVAAHSDAGQGARVFVRDDGALVREHRQNAPEPGLRGTVPRPGVEAKVAPSMILAVRNAMRPIVHACARSLPGDATRQDPRVQSQVIVSIDGGRLVVDEAIVEPGGMSEADAGILRECVESQVEALVLPADEHPVVSRHTLRLPYRLNQ